MTGNPWRAELFRAIAGGVALGLLGWPTGHPAAFVLAGGVVYCGWHAVQLYRLADWLHNGRRGKRPVARGPWREIYADLDRLQRKNRKKKKRLASIIDRFQQVAAVVPDGAVVLRGRDEISWLNPAAQRLLGLRSPQDIGQPLSNLVRTPALVEYLARGEFERPLELDGPVASDLKLLVRVVPYGENRRLLMARDISRLHRLEQMRRDFVANVSHELRSPLTVINGYLEAMDDDTDGVPAGWRRPVELMRQQSQRMCTIVDDLLQLSRLENDPGGAARKPVDIAAMLRSIEVEARGLGAGTHEITLEAEEDLWLLGEHAELYSAFSNIVFNAVHYTPAGGTIDIRWRAAEAESDGAVLSVTDSGIGIDPRHLPRLTERGQGALARQRRHRPRARHRQARARPPRRRAAGRQRARRRQHLRGPLQAGPPDVAPVAGQRCRRLTGRSTPVGRAGARSARAVGTMSSLGERGRGPAGRTTLAASAGTPRHRRGPLRVRTQRP